MADLLQDEERLKYEKVWTYDFYRDQADGLGVVDYAYHYLGCRPGDTLIDWGCGKGTPAAKFAAHGMKVTGFDIAHNCLDKDVALSLVVGCLWDPDLDLKLPIADFAFCTDVLEHVPPARLDRALKNISAHTYKAAFIQVCTTADTAGAKMDPPAKLHLSVYPAPIWESKLCRYWTRVDECPMVGGKSRSAYLCFKE